MRRTILTLLFVFVASFAIADNALSQALYQNLSTGDFAIKGLSMNTESDITGDLWDLADNNVQELKGAWFFDQTGATTTITDRSDKAKNMTLSANASTLTPSTDGLLRNLKISSGAYFEVADDDTFTFGTNDFTILVAGTPLTNWDSGTKNILSKFSLETAAEKREWAFYFASGKIHFTLYDNSSGDYIGRRYNTALTDLNTFHVYIVTHSAGVIKIYRDGVQVDDTYTSSGVFNTSSNTTAKIGNFTLSSAGARTNIGLMKYNLVTIYNDQCLTANQVKKLTNRILGAANKL